MKKRWYDYLNVVCYTLLLLLLGAKLHTFSTREIGPTTTIPYLLILLLLLPLSFRLLKEYKHLISKMWEYFIKPGQKIEREVSQSLVFPMSTLGLFTIVIFGVFYYFIYLSSQDILPRGAIINFLIPTVSNSMDVAPLLYKEYAHLFFLLTFIMLIISQIALLRKHYKENIFRATFVFLGVNVLFAFLSHLLSFIIYYILTIITFIVGILILFMAG